MVGRRGSAWQLHWPAAGVRVGEGHYRCGKTRRPRAVPSPSALKPNARHRPGSLPSHSPQRRRAKPVIVTEASPFDENLGYPAPLQNAEAPPPYEPAWLAQSPGSIPDGRFRPCQHSPAFLFFSSTSSPPPASEPSRTGRNHQAGSLGNIRTLQSGCRSHRPC